MPAHAQDSEHRADGSKGIAPKTASSTNVGPSGDSTQALTTSRSVVARAPSAQARDRDVQAANPPREHQRGPQDTTANLRGEGIDPLAHAASSAATTSSLNSRIQPRDTAQHVAQGSSTFPLKIAGTSSLTISRTSSLKISRLQEVEHVIFQCNNVAVRASQLAS
ncbi:hypothetical protein EXIGLDRAFT_762157 [Exidia glandulosa HHB12029]|uniref:Uncharacterized protein n=1 Tax=Exidia glandulosa HHB12029 TaxID=1314781 RepID=A0A165IBJ7_EXIGL|nr:hypothetical protein EXIGLDRAFT_768291 [Exidia glandulosa HHB12029]KZW00063.1 hypothetical protein EXIGLDRAFT_762157 [Exidia glandulosa HHB12029]